MRNRETDQWFKETVRTYEPKLLRFLGKMVPHAVAREIVQEGFLKLLSQDPQVIRGHLAEWLFTVCRNSARDFLRKEKFTPLDLIVAIDPAPLPSQDMETRQQFAQIQKLISQLSTIEQEVMRLKFQEGFSYKEISRITGHSLSYVGVLIHQSVSKIRADLLRETKGVKNATGT